MLGLGHPLYPFMIGQRSGFGSPNVASKEPDPIQTDLKDLGFFEKKSEKYWN